MSLFFFYGGESVVSSLRRGRKVDYDGNQHKAVHLPAIYLHGTDNAQSQHAQSQLT